MQAISDRKSHRIHLGDRLGTLADTKINSAHRLGIINGGTSTYKRHVEDISVSIEETKGHS